MSYSRKPDLPVSHSSPLSTWLSVLIIFSSTAKTTLSGQGYGFVGGGGNIAIATALSPSSFVYCIVNIKQFMEFLYLIFYACLRLRFLDVETNPGPRRPVSAVCIIICSNVRGLAWNLSDPTVASNQYDILFCSETLVSDFRHVSELLVPGFSRPVMLCRSKLPGARGMAAYTYEMVTEHFANTNFSVIVAKCWFLGFVV